MQQEIHQFRAATADLQAVHAGAVGKLPGGARLYLQKGHVTAVIPASATALLATAAVPPRAAPFF